MARGFDIVGRIKLTGPTNIAQVVNSIKKELKGVSVDVKVNIGQDTVRKIAQLNANLKSLKNTFNDIASTARSTTEAINQLNSVTGKFKSGSSGLSSLKAGTKEVKAGFDRATDAATSFGHATALAVKRAAAFAVATGPIFLLARAFTTGAKAAVDFQDDMVKLSQVSGLATKDLSGLSNEVTRLSTTLGVSSSSLLNVSKTLAQAGLSIRETKVALEAIAKASLAPSFDDIDNAVEALIATTSQFRDDLRGLKIEARDFGEVLSSQNAVAKAFAVEMEDISTAIRIAGGVFAQASSGLGKPKDQLNEFVALLTSVRASTRESAAGIATALKTIFARLQRPEVADSLKEIGVEVRDVDGKFVGAYESIRRLSEGLKDIDPKDIRFAKIAEDVAGIRQIGKFIPLVKNFATAQKAYQVAQEGANSITEDAIKKQESLKTQFSKVGEEFLKLVRDIGDSSTFKTLAATAITLASKLIKVADTLREIIPLVTAIGAVKLFAGVPSFVKGFKQSVKSTGYGNIRGYASGGHIGGVGNQDSEPALLMPGEYVINKRAAQKIGYRALDRINSGNIERFAGGGKKQRTLERAAARKAKLAGRDYTIPPDEPAAIIEKLTSSSVPKINSGFGGYSASKFLKGNRFPLEPLQQIQGLPPTRYPVPVIPETGLIPFDSDEYGLVADPLISPTGPANSSSGVRKRRKPRFSVGSRALAGTVRQSSVGSLDIGPSGLASQVRSATAIPEFTKKNARESIIGSLVGQQGVQGVVTGKEISSGFKKMSLTTEQYTQALQRTTKLVLDGIPTQKAIEQVKKDVIKTQKTSAISEKLGSRRISAKELVNAGVISSGDLPGGRSKLFPTFSKFLSRGGNSQRTPGLLFKKFDVSGGEKLQQRLFLASIAGTTLGSTIQSKATSAKTAALGGGISGASVGASIGGLAGPLGAALGGIVGAALGAKDAFLEFEKSQVLKRIEEAADKAAKSLEKTGNVGSSFSGLSLALKQKAINEDQTRNGSVTNSLLGGGSAASRKASGKLDPLNFAFADAATINRVAKEVNKEELEAFLQPQIELAEKLKSEILRAASNGEDISKFKTSSNIKALAFTDKDVQKRQKSLANNASINVPDLLNQADKLASLNAGLKVFDDEISQITTALNASSIAFKNIDLLAEKLSTLGSVLDRISTISEKASNSSDTLLSSLSGGLGLTRSVRENPFNNPAGFSNAEFKTAFSSIGSFAGLGGNGNFNKLQSSALASKNLERDLPELVKTALAKTADNADFAKVFKDSLPKDLPKEILDALTAKANVIGGQPKDVERNTENVVNAFKDIPQIKNSLETSAKLFDQYARAQDLAVQELNKVATARKIVEDRLTDVDSVRLEGLKRTTGRDRDLTSAELLTPFRNRIGRLTGGSTDAKALAGGIISARTELAGRLNGDPAGRDLRREAELIETITKNTEALDLLKDSSAQLAVIEEKRSRIESKRQAANGLTNDIFGGGLKGRLDLGRQFGRFAQFSRGSNKAFSLNSLSGETFNDVKSVVDRLAGLRRASGDEKGAKAIEENFSKRTVEALKKQGLSAENADFLTKLFGFDEEKELRKLETEVAIKQKEAAEALLTVSRDVLPRVGADLTAATEAIRASIRGAVAGSGLGKATGGPIYGPGTSTSDSIPAMLSRGEYVLPAHAVNSIGMDNLEYMRKTGSLPGYAAGGKVGYRAARAKLLGDRTRAKGLRESKARNLTYSNRVPVTTLDGRTFLTDFNTLRNNKTYEGAIRQDFGGLTPRQARSVYLADLARRSVPTGARSPLRELGISTGRLGKGIINSPVRKFASGGPVGGIARGAYTVGKLLSGGGSQQQQQVNVNGGTFATAANNLATALNNVKIPEVITVTGTHKHELIINGAAILQDLLGGPLGQYIKQEIDAKLSKSIPLEQRLGG